MAITIALGGDTMLGRGVGEEITAAAAHDACRLSGLFGEEVHRAFAGADVRVVNLECCVSRRGRTPDIPGHPFHFRAPPEAVGVLTGLGVDCVTLANNHAMDYGPDALNDTLEHLARGGVRTVGAGRDRRRARSPAVLTVRDTSVAVFGVTDHPAEYAAGEHSPGIAYAPLACGVPAWLGRRIREAADRYDVVLVTPHWGPNMTTAPPGYVREAADAFLDAGATLVAGHSAHVFHGVNGPILYDLGDLVDDYARDEVLRNDLGLLWLVTIDDEDVKVEALPLHLTYARTIRADPGQREWIKSRLARACDEFAMEVTERDGFLIVTKKRASAPMTAPGRNA